jgi:hypothetical protein
MKLDSSDSLVRPLTVQSDLPSKGNSIFKNFFLWNSGHMKKKISDHEMAMIAKRLFERMTAILF